MIVLVCGGRDYNERERIFSTLDDYHCDFRFTHLIHGAAPGADALAHVWSTLRGVQPVACKALWEYYRRIGRVNSAGPIRNAAMLKLGPELVIAFPGGRGTQDMIDAASAAGVPVISLIRAWTDYPIPTLGDSASELAPVREVEILDYDRDKYCHIRVSRIVEQIKACYLYAQPGRCGDVPQISHSALERLPVTRYQKE